MRLLVLAAGCLLATAAEPPLPSLAAEPVRDGSAIRIRNTATVPLSAFIVEIVDYPGNRFRMVQDELWGQPIASGQQREYRTAALMPGAVPEYLKVQAAIYSDGTTAGQLTHIAILLDGRRISLRGIRAVLDRVSSASPLENAHIIASLQAWKETIAPELRFVVDTAIRIVKSEGVAAMVDEYKRAERLLASSKPDLH
ncbi:MAG TPA: hypothetical protein VER03_04730 [Bryobacteraceae bacterium]|nr:hypothetical protein [Bryobacteraceae bacterium]